MFSLQPESDGNTKEQGHRTLTRSGIQPIPDNERTKIPTEHEYIMQELRNMNTDNWQQYCTTERPGKHEPER